MRPSRRCRPVHPVRLMPSTVQVKDPSGADRKVQTPLKKADAAGGAISFGESYEL